MLSLFFGLCVGIRLPCGLLCAGCAHDVSGITNLANNMAVEQLKAGGLLCTL
jgi:hypothetical protein